MAFLIFGYMEALKYYLRLNETTLELCKSWIGKEILSISAMEMQKDWTTAEMIIPSELYITLHAAGQPYRIWQEEIEMEGIPVSFALRIENSNAGHKPVVFQFNQPFVIKKIEIWAEKTQDSSGLGDTTQLTENTLLFMAESGDRWLLVPDHPGPGFLLAWGEREMNRILHSGWYVLKHILD